MSADGQQTEQSPPVANSDHNRTNMNKGPAPKAPAQKSKIVMNGVPKERDPRKLNQHLMLSFNEVIGEPGPGVYSFDSVWSFSSEIFTFTKLWCYRILSLIFAIPCSIVWAIMVALLSFLNIWCFIPVVKISRIPMIAFEQAMRIIMDTFVAPTTHAVGRMFAHISMPPLKKETAIIEKKFIPNDVHLA